MNISDWIHLVVIRGEYMAAFSAGDWKDTTTTTTTTTDTVSGREGTCVIQYDLSAGCRLAPGQTPDRLRQLSLARIALPALRTWLAPIT